MRLKMPNVEFEEISDNTVLLLDGKNTELNIKVSVTLSITNKWDFNAVVKVNNDLICAYNKDNGTTLKALPADSYVLENSVLLTFLQV